MAATFQVAKTYGDSGSPTREDIGDTGNIFNFMTEDSNTEANYSSHPITASDDSDEGNSYEVFLQLHFSGTFNKIDNCQFWMSTDFSPNTGLTLNWDGETESYSTPTTDDSAIATTGVPTSDPGTANVSIGGNLSGNLTSAGYTDYIVLQLHVGTTAAPGDTSLAEFTIQYDEQ